MGALQVRSVVGGARVVGEGDLVTLVRSGLPVGSVHFLLESGRLTQAELDRLVLPRKTLANRRRLGSLTPDQSDRLIRLARILAAAEETFGTQAKAAIWLRRATSALAGERPLDLLDTDEGTRRVEALLADIDHGIAA
jgi:putative toxin-antitoxin system antitoxin component (TIGR02293 family)